MRQCFQRSFRLDRFTRPVYLGGGLRVGLGLLLASCRPAAPGAVVPADVAPVSAADVQGWVGATVPRESRLHRFKWLYLSEERGRPSSVGGRGSARIAPPDSLRFDAAAQFDAQTIAAVVIGDQPLWAEPPDSLDKLVPNYPLLWAMFGIARGPGDGAELRGLADSRAATWRYATGADTVDYRYTRDPDGRPSVLTVEVRRAGRVVGRAETKLGPDGVPLKARLVVPSAPAKLDITFLSTRDTTFEPGIWRHRSP
jgi:hypothetical protein